MATLTIAKEYNALPWYGCSVVVFELTANPSSNTVEMATRGFTSVRALWAFDNTATIVAAAVTVTANGTLVTFASGMSAVVTLIVLGR